MRVKVREVVASRPLANSPTMVWVKVTDRQKALLLRLLPFPSPFLPSVVDDDVRRGTDDNYKTPFFCPVCES